MARVHMKGNVDIDEFRKRLKEAIKRNTPVDDLCELSEELVIYEQKYSIKSPVFYDRFMRGEMGDDRDFIRWSGKYEMFLKLKAMIEERIQIVGKKHAYRTLQHLRSALISKLHAPKKGKLMAKVLNIGL